MAGEFGTKPSGPVSCPGCGKADHVIKSKFNEGELVCYKARGGCGRKWHESGR